jgi:dCTP deaminase
VIALLEDPELQIQPAVKLYPGMRISQVALRAMTSVAERPYGAGRGRKYQGQSGRVISRISRDES